MNIGVLNKIRVISGERNTVIEQIQQNLRKAQFKEHSETAYYLSADPQDFFSLSFWYSLQAYEEAAVRFQANLDPKFVSSLEWQSSNIFKLIWEHRKVHLRAAASNLRLMIFPPDQIEERIQQDMEYVRVRANREQFSGLVATWTGRSLNGEPITLRRVDWASLEEQQHFFAQKSTADIIARRRAEGVKLEYASFDLRGIYVTEAN